MLPISTTPDAEEGSRFVVPRGFSITATTESPYEASLALRYLAETEQAVGQVLTGSAPPRHSEALENSPELDEYMPFFTPEIREAFLEGVPNPPSTNFGAIEEVLGELVNGLVGGDTTPPADLAAQVQAELDELKE